MAGLEVLLLSWLSIATFEVTCHVLGRRSTWTSKKDRDRKKPRSS